MQRTLKRELKVLEVVERETKVTPKKTGDPFTWVTHNKKLWLSFAGGSRFGLARGNSARFFFSFFPKISVQFLTKKNFWTVAGSFFLVRASQHQLRENLFFVFLFRKGEGEKA